MNKFVVFVFGAAFGAVTTGLIVRNRYESIIKEEFAAINEGEDRIFDESAPDPDAKKTTKESQGVVEYIKRDVEENRKIIQYNDIQKKIIKNNGYAGSDLQEREPYIINVEEFSEEAGNHEKLTLYYYIGDGTLCDENEDIIPEKEMIIGRQAIEALDNLTAGDSGSVVMYVRNHNIGSDYEIIGLFGNYSDLKSEEE